MTPEEFRDARQTIGEAWGLGRPLSLQEMGDILRFRSVRPRDRVNDMETGKAEVTGPVSRVVEALLDGWRPRDIRLQRQPSGYIILKFLREAA